MGWLIDHMTLTDRSHDFSLQDDWSSRPEGHRAPTAGCQPTPWGSHRLRLHPVGAGSHHPLPAGDQRGAKTNENFMEQTTNLSRWAENMAANSGVCFLAVMMDSSDCDEKSQKPHKLHLRELTWLPHLRPLPPPKKSVYAPITVFSFIVSL